jgi:putative drug exporter of the RND superfamily
VVTPTADPDTTTAHRLVKDLRSEVSAVRGTGITAQLAGATATGSDFDNLVVRSLPLVVGVVAVLSLLILTFAFGSVPLPLLALAFNGMVVAASLGALALISADAQDTINSVTPLMLFAVMFGLSMDYMVIMISRMRELHAEGLHHREAVIGGLSRTAGLVNGAAVIMVAVFASFSSAQISIVREIGISLAIAVVLDAVVIRRLVMPATLLLIGERVWGRRRQRTDAAGPPAPTPNSPPTRNPSQGVATR